MLEGAKICEMCTKRRKMHGEKLCHSSLIPERIEPSGSISTINPEERALYIDCRHFSCSVTGKPAAREALLELDLNNYYVDELGQILAVSFGTSEKPTEDGLRIVSNDGIIYSYQNGNYYPTGQSI